MGDAARTDYGLKGLFMGSLLHDFKYSLRTVRLNPGFTAVAVLSLAIGIGANTAIYSLYSTIFHADRGVSDPKEIVQIYNSDSDYADSFQNSYPEYLVYRDQTTDVFEDLITYTLGLALLDLGETSDMIFLEEVSGNYFDMLGVEPLLGRSFVPEEDDIPGAAPTLVLNHTSWRRLYASDPGIVGKTVYLNGNACTIIGVAPPDFAGMFPIHVDFWSPIHMHDIVEPGAKDLTDWGQTDFWMKGRLKEGVTTGQAGEALRIVGQRLIQERPERDERLIPVIVSPKWALIMPTVDSAIRLLSWFLMGLVGLVIIIACTNLAGILLARASARQREIGVRLAIGASRWQLMRQLLIESVSMSLLGGAAGLLVAHWMIKYILAIRPPFPIPFNLHFGVNGDALLFTLVLSLLTGIIFGLLPARHATNPDILSALKGISGRLAIRYRRFGMKNSLIVAQVAISSLLLLCTGLFLRSLSNASSVDTGFDIEQGIIFRLPVELAQYDIEEADVFVGDAKRSLEAIPGVEVTGFSEYLPLNLDSSTNTIRPLYESGEESERSFNVSRGDASPDYFRAMGIPILHGRPFDDTDIRESEPVAIINATFAERFWPGENAVGKQFRLVWADRIHTVVGIARDGKYNTLGEETQPYFYLAARQGTFNNDFLNFIVRSSVEPAQLIPEIRERIRALNPHMPIFDIKTVAGYKGMMLFIPRLVTSIASALGLFALVLGITGLYGVIAFEVTRRTREIGIRIAMGARKGNVLGLFVWKGLRLVVTGLAIGLILAGLISQGLTALLFGISPLDPVTFIGIPLILVGVTIAATLTPARRAAGVSPVDALRQE